MNWFEVDKKGLAKLMASRPIFFIVYELLQNAWDQNVTQVDVSVQRVGRNARITVTDDDPDGFADLKDAYTLFAESSKVRCPEQRGRFNLGEKLVLALAKEAYVSTTKGTVEFNDQGRFVHPKMKRATGSACSVVIPMSRQDFDSLGPALYRVIPPEDITTRINGFQLEPEKPVYTLKVTLPTVIGGRDGVLRRTKRATTLAIYETVEGWLYEMGIPVVKIGGRYNVNVWQKVPLNMERDNVPASYLKEIWAHLLNATYVDLYEEEATDSWVREACASSHVAPIAVKQVMSLRFGEDAVRYDPSDPEANKLAVADGRQVVHGGSLSAPEWENVTLAQALPPAGKVTPSPKPYGGDKPLNVIAPTQGMQDIGSYIERLSLRLLDKTICITFVKEPKWPFQATFGDNGLVLNTSKLDCEVISDELNAVLIHEFAHHWSSDHLSKQFHTALAKLGARMTRLAIEQPEVFQ